MKTFAAKVRYFKLFVDLTQKEAASIQIAIFLIQLCIDINEGWFNYIKIYSDHIFP